MFTIEKNDYLAEWYELNGIKKEHEQAFYEILCEYGYEATNWYLRLDTNPEATKTEMKKHFIEKFKSEYDFDDFLYDMFDHAFLLFDADEIICRLEKLEAIEIHKQGKCLIIFEGKKLNNNYGLKKAIAQYKSKATSS